MFHIKTILKLFICKYKIFKHDICKYNYDQLVKVLRNISNIYEIRIVLNKSPYHVIFDSDLEDDVTGNWYINYMCKEIKVDKKIAKNCVKSEKFGSSLIENDSKYYYSIIIGSTVTISGPAETNNFG